MPRNLRVRVVSAGSVTWLPAHGPPEAIKGRARQDLWSRLDIGWKGSRVCRLQRGRLGHSVDTDQAWGFGRPRTSRVRRRVCHGPGHCAAGKPSRLRSLVGRYRYPPVPARKAAAQIRLFHALRRLATIFPGWKTRGLLFPTLRPNGNLGVRVRRRPSRTANGFSRPLWHAAMVAQWNLPCL
jgi:hypothetical protein